MVQSDKERVCVGLTAANLQGSLSRAQTLAIISLRNTLHLLFPALPPGSSHCNELSYTGTGLEE